MATESESKLDRLVAQTQKDRSQRELSYRGRALKMYPWVCGRCMREFTNKNLRELTVHHRDHNHDYNPPDGSNWELLCVYCHDNEHSRFEDAASTSEDKVEGTNHQPFSDLASLLKLKEKPDKEGKH